MYAVDVTAEPSHLGLCARSALPQDCPAVCGTLNVRTRRAGLCAGTCSRFTSQQAAWNSGPFFSQVHGSPWAAAIYYHLGGWSTA